LGSALGSLAPFFSAPLAGFAAAGGADFPLASPATHIHVIKELFKNASYAIMEINISRRIQ
jgi:hypothetical protein